MTRLTSTNTVVICRIRSAIFNDAYGGKRFHQIMSNSVSMISLNYNLSPIILAEAKLWLRLLPKQSNKKAPGPGSRVRNFTIMTVEGNKQKLYDVTDRSSH